MNQQQLRKIVESLPDDAEIEGKIKWICRFASGIVKDKAELILKRCN